MDAIKKSWPTLAFISSAMIFLGLGTNLILSVHLERLSSVRYSAEVLDNNPYHGKFRKKRPSGKSILVRYHDETGQVRYTLARMHNRPYVTEGDSVIIFLDSKKKVARINGWQDWLPGFWCIFLGCLIFGAGILMRHVLKSAREFKHLEEDKGKGLVAE